MMAAESATSTPLPPSTPRKALVDISNRPTLSSERDNKELTAENPLRTIPTSAGTDNIPGLSTPKSSDLTKPVACKRARDEDDLTPWIDAIDISVCKSYLDCVDQELMCWAESQVPGPTEYQRRHEAFILLKKHLETEWSDATAHLFGSLATGLYTQSSDLDVVLMSDVISHMDPAIVLAKIGQLLQKAGLVQSFETIPKAKVPILKFTLSAYQLPVDLSLNSRGGVDAANYIRKYTSPSAPGNLAIRAIVIFVKRLLAQLSLNEVFTGGLGGYSLVCLVISYIQTHPAVLDDPSYANQHIGRLFIDFFSLYGSAFNYELVGISIRDGGLFDRTKKTAGTFGLIRRSKGSVLAIEDPMNPSNSISAGSFKFWAVRLAFATIERKLAQKIAANSRLFHLVRSSEESKALTASICLLPDLLATSDSSAKRPRVCEDDSN